MLKQFTNFFKFNDIGVLGINARNLGYIRAYNTKKAFRLADNKIHTKQFLSARDIPVPKLYHVISNRSGLEKFDFNILPEKFVLKPNYGYGGEGIIVINGRDSKGHFKTISGRIMSKNELYSHIEDIIDGRFSLSNQRDKAFFEQLIECNDTIAKFSYNGLPDIRIVVYNLIPVMAMLRLPSVASDGKANLHLGAIGVGIDIATGKATHIMQHNKIIDEVPSRGDIRDLVIPYWDKMLLIASKIQLTTNIGYLAVDLAVDRNSGPVLLEVNARAGLAVQIANLAPLKRRLERIKGVKVLGPEKGVRVAQDMFGNKLDKEIKNISGKEVVGIFEEVSLYLPDGAVAKFTANINTSLDSTIIDESFLEFFKNCNDLIEGDIQKIRIKFSLADQRIQTLATVQDLSGKDYKMIIGRKDISNYFLVDPSKIKIETKLPEGNEKKSNTKIILKESLKKVKINFVEIDKVMSILDSKIKLLYYLRPLNLNDEKKKFFESDTYNPQFTYSDLKFDPYSLRSDLEKIILDDSGYGKLFNEKREEILKKVKLLESRATSDFMKASIALYGHPSKELYKIAKEELEEGVRQYKGDNLDDEETGVINSTEVSCRFDLIFKKYKIAWKTKLKDDLVARCIAGKKNALFVRKDAQFSEERIKGLVAHEIETHILSAENGKKQPYSIFNRGTANYLETQEGLAIYNTNFVFKDDKNFINLTPQAIVVATHIGEQGSFRDIYNAMFKFFSREKSFRIALKLKRGLEDTSKPGIFTKDYIYFNGFKKIEKFVENGGDIKQLYIGKVSINDIDWIMKLPGIIKPRYLPKWL